MREIKFRGKDIKGIWRYGDLMTMKHFVANVKEYNIGDFESSLVYKIDKETIGQYTGLKDKNGKEIYEGDIVYCQTKFGKAKAVIEFIDGKFVAYWNSVITHPKNGHHIACYDINKRFEVIGNIYENKELQEE